MRAIESKQISKRAKQAWESKQRVKDNEEMGIVRQNTHPLLHVVHVHDNKIKDCIKKWHQFHSQLQKDIYLKVNSTPCSLTITQNCMLMQ